MEPHRSETRPTLYTIASGPHAPLPGVAAFQGLRVRTPPLPDSQRARPGLPATALLSSQSACQEQHALSYSREGASCPATRRPLRLAPVPAANIPFLLWIALLCFPLGLWPHDSGLSLSHQATPSQPFSVMQATLGLLAAAVQSHMTFGKSSVCSFAQAESWRSAQAEAGMR